MSVTNPKFNPSGKPSVSAIKQKGLELEDTIRKHGVDNRRKQIALVRLEEALMWAVKSCFEDEG